MKKFSLFISVFVCAAVAGFAQNVSSSLRAVVLDSTAAAVPGAECALTNQATSTALTVNSDNQGLCVFNIIPAGTYTLVVQSKGFKALSVKNVAVDAGQTRTLGNLTLEVGALSESIQVTGEVSQINLATAEKAGSITMTQLQNVAVKGRDMFALMTTIPGIVDNLSQGRETTSPDSLRGTFINGSRENAKNYAVDGITNLDTGSNNTLQFEPNMDSIAEVKVLTSNFQAEYGRNGGGVITVITRGGGQDFHVSGVRHVPSREPQRELLLEQPDQSGEGAVPLSHHGIHGGRPGFHSRRSSTPGATSLFFFWNQEYTGQKKDYGTRLSTMPTADERNGDFSKSVTGSGTAIKIIDPLNGVQFPGNIIPKSRFNALGLSMLSFLPLPNYVDPTNVNNSNYKSTYTGAYPKREDMVRIDANISSTLQVYWRYVQDKDEQQTPYGLWVNGGINYLLAPITFGQPGKGHVAHITKSISSTTVNEFIFGLSKNKLYFYPTDSSLIDRAKVGNPGQWYSDTATGVSYLDKTSYMPNITFGGNHANPAVATFGNIPYENYNTVMSFVDNLSKVIGSHSLKAGVYFEHTEKFQVGGTNPRGAFNFSPTTTNPFDSGDGFSNALLGVLQHLLRSHPARQRRLDLQQPGVLRAGQLAGQQAVDPGSSECGSIICRRKPTPTRRSPGSARTCTDRANSPMLYMPTIDPPAASAWRWTRGRGRCIRIR